MGSLRVEPKQNMNQHSTAYGKWYFRAFYNQQIDVTELAKHIAKDSKVESSKVATITSALVKQMGELLCNGHPIRVPHLGILKLGVTSEGTDTVSEFNARTAIKNLYVMLVPEKEIKEALRMTKFVKFIQKDAVPARDDNNSDSGNGEDPDNTGGTASGGGGGQGDSGGGQQSGGQSGGGGAPADDDTGD